MPSPRKRRQKKVLLREQEREEVMEMLPIEEEAPTPKKKTIAKQKNITKNILKNETKDDFSFNGLAQQKHK